MASPPTAPTLLRAWREAEKLTQGEAATLADVSQNAWCEWEGGRKTPRTAQALVLQALTKGKVPAWAWLKKAELALLRRFEAAA